MFEWTKNNDIASLRSHDCKHFVHPTEPKKRICIQSSRLLHYHDGAGFRDIIDIKFPEGKLINSEKDLEMIDIPEWGRAEISADGKTAKIYDKRNISIFKFYSPIVAEKDVIPFDLKEKVNGQKDLVKINPKDIDEAIEKIKGDAIKTLKKDAYTPAEFEIKNNKICFKLPAGTEPKDLRAYDDTDTGSTNEKDNTMYDYSTLRTTNDGTGPNLQLSQTTSNNNRVLISWTLSSGSGSISDVKLYLYNQNKIGTASFTVDVHELSRSDWVETEATYTIYKTGSNWTTPFGDYNATVIDTDAGRVTTGNWNNWTLMGSGATNPLTLTWEDGVHLLLKCTTENGQAAFNGDQYASRNAAGNYPYLQITYTAGGTNWTKDLSDTFGITDANAKGVGKTATDSLGIADAAGKGTAKAITDGQTIADASAKGVVKNMSENLTLTDDLLNSAGKIAALSDSMGITDGSTRGLGKILADTLGITDAMSRVVAFFKSLSDNLSIIDTIVKTYSGMAHKIYNKRYGEYQKRNADYSKKLTE